MDTGINSQIEQQKKAKAVNFRKRLIVFLVCIFLSVFFWFLSVFGKYYNDVIQVKAVYINLPIYKVVANDLPEKISLKIRAQGFDLLKYKFLKFPISVNIDAKSIKSRLVGNVTKDFITASSFFPKIASQINPEFELIEIKPDTIFFNFDAAASKKIPVHLNTLVNIEKQFFLSDSIKIFPDSVTVSGPKSIIDTLKCLYTEHFEKDHIKKSEEFFVNISIPKLRKKIFLSTDKVAVTMHVTKYTEGKFNIPIEVLNLPPNYSYETFPSKATVYFKVSLDNYEKVSPFLFKLTIDYLNPISTIENNAKIEVSRAPDFVVISRIVPSTVEFIVKK